MEWSGFTSLQSCQIQGNHCRWKAMVDNHNEHCRGGWNSTKALLPSSLVQLFSHLLQRNTSSMIQSWNHIQKDSDGSCSTKSTSFFSLYRSLAITMASWFLFVAQVGGFMLLHHLFKELVLIEVASSPDIWPIADRALDDDPVIFSARSQSFTGSSRSMLKLLVPWSIWGNASFEVKIFAESVPSLWFQISLFCCRVALCCIILHYNMLQNGYGSYHFAYAMQNLGFWMSRRGFLFLWKGCKSCCILTILGTISFTVMASSRALLLGKKAWPSPTPAWKTGCSLCCRLEQALLRPLDEWTQKQQLWETLRFFGKTTFLFKPKDTWAHHVWSTIV